jgi:hypothetical protein
MKKFFPADFPQKARVAPPPPAVSSPVSSSSIQTASTLSAANKVGMRFTGKSADGKEILECAFALTPEEKVEFERCLPVVGPSQVQSLLLQAMKQAAKAANSQPAAKPGEKQNHENNQDSKNGARAASPATTLLTLGSHKTDPPPKSPASAATAAGSSPGVQFSKKISNSA